MAAEASSPVRAPRDDSRDGMWLLISWIVLSIIGCLLVALVLGPHMPPGAQSSSAASQQTDITVLATIATPVVIGVVLYLGWALAFWRQRPGDETDAAPIHGNTKVQTTWIIATSAIVLSLAVYGTVELISPAGAGAGEGPQPIWKPAGTTTTSVTSWAPGTSNILQVQVIGQQWAWTYRYPQFGGFETTQLMLPVGEPVQFNITSLDVIHSFWAYTLAVKADANPGVNNVAYTTPEHTGQFQVRCAELCGIWHGSMARGLEPVPEAHRRDEIGLLTRSFNDMVGQLRRAREREQELNRLERFTALGQLAGGLAHEIKNPLNFISLALDQLRMRYAPQQPNDREAFLHQLGIMKDEMRRLAGLVQSFLHYGKPIEIFPAPTDVLHLVDEVVALSESKMKSQGIGVDRGMRRDADPQGGRGEAAHLFHQRGRQRDPGDAGRRQDANCVSARRCGRIDDDQFLGHWCRNRSRCCGPCLRAVLHHQARRHRSRAFSVEGDRRDSWRYNRYRAERGRTRDHFDFHLPAERSSKRTPS